MRRRPVTLDSMIRKTKRSIRKVEQMIRDVEYRSSHRTDAPPFDLGRERVMLVNLKAHLAELEKRPAPGQLTGKYIEAILENERIARLGES